MIEQKTHPQCAHPPPPTNGEHIVLIINGAALTVRRNVTATLPNLCLAHAIVAHAILLFKFNFRTPMFMLQNVDARALRYSAGCLTLAKLKNIHMHLLIR